MSMTMKVPVRPIPALQCTTMGPASSKLSLIVQYSRVLSTNDPYPHSTLEDKKFDMVKFFIEIIARMHKSGYYSIEYTK